MSLSFVLGSQYASTGCDKPLEASTLYLFSFPRSDVIFLTATEGVFQYIPVGIFIIIIFLMNLKYIQSMWEGGHIISKPVSQIGSGADSSRETNKGFCMICVHFGWRQTDNFSSAGHKYDT